MNFVPTVSPRSRAARFAIAALALLGLVSPVLQACTRGQHSEAAPQGASSEAMNNARNPREPDPLAPVTVVPGDKVKPLPGTGADPGTLKPEPEPAPEPGADRGPEPSTQPAPGESAPTPGAATEKPRKARGSLGTNLDQLADWSPEQPLVDIFKTSRAWISGNEGQWDDGRPVHVDSEGWVRSLLPAQIARTTLLWDGVPFTAGQYTVLTEGEGTVEYAQQNGNKELVKHTGQGRHVIALDPGRGGLSLSIVAINPHNPLRNIRILMPGGSCAADATQWCNAERPCSAGACVPFENSYRQTPFNPLFLDRIRNYSVLRFMDWMDTNEETPRSWSTRPKASDARYTVKGAPVELMVELANRTGKDAWFCMPHLADDDYVTRFAGYVRDNLQRGNKAYVEYSNEVWNSQFPQADHAQKLGMKSRLGRNAYESQMRYYAKRATHVMKLWERAFANDMSRIVRVIASQSGNSWVSKQILDFQDTAKHADALAIAPYFGGRLGNPDQQSRVQRMNVDQLLAELRTKALPEVAESVAEQAEVARDFKVRLIAYEGGQHLAGVGPVAENDRINELFDAANRDPRMKDVYAKYLADWRKNGGQLFVHFSNCARYSKWGRWGALESLTQPRAKAPKFDALQEFIQRNPPWW
jgi:hypothetical protein